MRCSVVGGDAPAVVGETDERARPRAAESEETKSCRGFDFISRPAGRQAGRFHDNSLNH